MCDVAGCERLFDTMGEVIDHERLHRAPAAPSHTIDIGPVHVGKHQPGQPWECVDNCPHPDHSGRCPGCNHPKAPDGVDGPLDHLAGCPAYIGSRDGSDV